MGGFWVDFPPGLGRVVAPKMVIPEDGQPHPAVAQMATLANFKKGQ
jgi:hypothetical protein